MNQAIWKPSPERISQANLTRFIRYVDKQVAQEIDDYHALYGFSVNRPEEFWPMVWEFCGIRSSKSWSNVLINKDQMPGAKWFTDARLNFAENLLREQDDTPAIVFCNEKHDSRQLSYRELYQQTATIAAKLIELGVKPGDRIAGFLPNLPETVIAMLATTSIGATWSSCSPDFGINGVIDRFGQIQPKVLFAADGYFYGGKEFNCFEKINGITQAIDSIKQTIVVSYRTKEPDLSELATNAILFNDILTENQTAKLEFKQLPFDHPLYILYSSGTTGTPKCIVHGAGNTLIQHLKELVLHTDLKRGDVIFYYTTCGWMMWNWLISSLAVGATVVLYDGSPFFPNGNILFDLIDKLKINIFGTSAKYISSLEKANITPNKTHELSSLRTILSTGSPLAPASFEYVYRDIKTDVCLSSISGGTDIVSCFAIGNPILPVYSSELQCVGLGMKVEILDADNQAVKNQPGELACTTPFPSMPIGFWNDPDNSKYQNAYFSKAPNIWCHGDLAELTRHGGLIIHGRSDATLNPGGVRIGTAEIYRQVEKLPFVVESIAVGQKWHDDERIILFVILAKNTELTEQLIRQIKIAIRMETTPRHVPAKVIAVPDIPRTISGKIVELAVKNIIHNRPVTNQDALANPETLSYFENITELNEE